MASVMSLRSPSFRLSPSVIPNMLRLGIVDFDSSHSVEFTRRFNHVGVDRDERVDGARVVAGWPGDSVMGPERIPGFLAEMRTFGVEIVDRLDDLIGQIDGVLVLSMCGEAHWKRARPFLEAGIPTFVDKPFACSIADAEAMVQLAEQNRVTLLGGSGMRFASDVLQLAEQRSNTGEVLGAIAYGPAKRASGNPGLLHYGVHAVEMLFQIMGTGCESVTTTWTEGSEVVTGLWKDGRIGTVRGNRRGSTAYGFVAFCEQGVVARDASSSGTYTRLCQAIVRSFVSHEPAISHASTLEVVRFIHAALASEKAHGAVVRLDHITSSHCSVP